MPIRRAQTDPMSPVAASLSPQSASSPVSPDSSSIVNLPLKRPTRTVSQPMTSLKSLGKEADVKNGVLISPKMISRVRSSTVAAYNVANKDDPGLDSHSIAEHQTILEHQNILEEHGLDPAFESKHSRSELESSRLTPFDSKSEVYGNHDQEYPTQADKIPSVEPVANYQDKLWTQIDVLDDVKKMSQEAAQNHTLFTPQYEAELTNLKTAQLSLLNSVKRMEKKMVSNKKRVWFDFDFDMEKSVELHHLYDEAYFDGIKDSIEESRVMLGQVADCMRNDIFDDENNVALLEDSDGS